MTRLPYNKRQEIKLIESKAPYISVVKASQETNISERFLRSLFSKQLRRMANRDYISPQVVNTWILADERP